MSFALASDSFEGPVDLSAAEEAPDCSPFDNDQAVLRAFPFPVPVDRVFAHPSGTYVQSDDNGRIIFVNIVREKDIPSVLFCLTELKHLSIEGSTLRSNHFRLPAAIARLASSLEELHISDTPIITLPEQLGQMKVLHTLKLHHTGLIHLPDSIGSLASLRILFLANNDLSSLPTSMRQMASLDQLTFSNNPRLGSLDSITGHPSLTKIEANNCSISKIPQNLPQLRFLSLSGNALTDLQGIETLGNATTKKISFSFSSNQIKTVPSEIRFVGNLALLNLNDNALTYLPRELAALPLLKVLHVKMNALSYREVLKLARIIRTTRPLIQIFY